MADDLFADRAPANQQMQPPSFAELKNDIFKIVQSHRDSAKKPYPTSVPHDHDDAVKWFIKLLPGQKHNEHVRERSTVKGKKYWVWPYADRVKYLVAKFFYVDEDMRNLIIAARHDRIEWRGDDFDQFVFIITETEKMQANGVENYRIESRGRRKEMLKKISDRINSATKGDEKTIEEKRQEAINYTGVDDQ